MRPIYVWFRPVRLARPDLECSGCREEVFGSDPGFPCVKTSKRSHRKAEIILVITTASDPIQRRSVSTDLVVLSILQQMALRA
ncbi:hypothetical protein DPMN_074300 [Dreissena polymorpha]|uniref:Uncharacterized protein n=1 Tax=Dreissena polymorpha TaxID=45954 RepID=A0A9D3YF02_DREPO|nr:hypothetical protein DPMN_074300 [Dreissena polymorpha]